jgi:hypothetical protein
VRVLSDGDNSAAGSGGGGGGQSTDDSTGGVQVGEVDVYAPIRIASDGGEAAEVPGTLQTSGLPGSADGDSPSGPEEAPSGVDRRARTVKPVLDGGGGLPAAAGLRPAALDESADAGELPLTGLSAWLVALAGGWLVASGLALWFASAVFKAGAGSTRDPRTNPLQGGRFVR